MVCPPIADYSSEFQNRLADQIMLLEPGSPAVGVILDYAELRVVIRACQAR